MGFHLLAEFEYGDHFNGKQHQNDLQDTGKDKGIVVGRIDTVGTVGQGGYGNHQGQGHRLGKGKKHHATGADLWVENNRTEQSDENHDPGDQEGG